MSRSGQLNCWLCYLNGLTVAHVFLGTGCHGLSGRFAACYSTSVAAFSNSFQAGTYHTELKVTTTPIDSRDCRSMHCLDYPLKILRFTRFVPMWKYGHQQLSAPLL